MKATTFRKSAVALAVAGAFALCAAMADHAMLLPASAVVVAARQMAERGERVGYFQQNHQ